MTLRNVLRSDRDVNLYGRLSPVVVARAEPQLHYRVATTSTWLAPTAELVRKTYARLNAKPTRENNAQRLYCASFMTRAELAELAMTFGGDKVPLSQTVLPFGPFTGLTFAQIVALEAGQVVANWKKPDGSLVTKIYPSVAQFNAVLRNHQQRRDESKDYARPMKPLAGASKTVGVVVVTSETEGVRYLDRLLDVDRHHWLFPNTYARVVLFLTDRRVRGDRVRAYSHSKPDVADRPFYVPAFRDEDLVSLVRNSRGLPKRLRKAARRDWLSLRGRMKVRWGRSVTPGLTDGLPLDALCVATYGDSEAIQPSDFVPFSEMPVDRWHGQARERLAKNGGRGADPDPTPDNWDLVDSTRAARGRMTAEDAWEDWKAPAFNDLEWDWELQSEDGRKARDRAMQGFRYTASFKAIPEVVTYALRDREEDMPCFNVPKRRPTEAIKGQKLVHAPVGLPAEPVGSSVKVRAVPSSHEEVASRRVWARGQQLLQQLSHVGGPSERPLAEYEAERADWEARRAQNRADDELRLGWYDRLDDLTATVKRDLGVTDALDDEVRFKWHDSVPQELRDALAAAVKEARERLDAEYLAQSRAMEEAAEAELLEAIGQLGRLALVLINARKYRDGARWSAPTPKPVARVEYVPLVPAQPEAAIGGDGEPTVTDSGKGRFQLNRVRYTYSWDRIDLGEGEVEYRVSVKLPGGDFLTRQEPASVETMIGWIKDEIREAVTA